MLIAKNPQKILFWLSIVALGLVILATVVFLSFYFNYRDKIYPRVFVANIAVAGNTPEQAKNILQSPTNTFAKNALTLKFENSDWTIKGSEIGLEYDLDKTAKKAFEYGRENFFGPLKLLFTRQNLDLDFTFDEDLFQQKIEALASAIDIPEQNANLVWKEKEKKTEISEPKIGRRLDQEKTKKMLLDAFSLMKKENINLVVDTAYPPEISKEQAQSFIPQFEKIIKKKVTFKAGDQEFKPTQNQLASFIDLGVEKKKPQLKINQDALTKYLKTIAEKVDSPAQNARLKLSGSKAVLFQASKDGKILNIDQSIGTISKALLDLQAPDILEINLPMKEEKPEITTDNINNLGIKELIGSGTTSFVGSPENRKHNIAVGAGLFNGVLIKPNDTFSFLQTLGKVTAEQGFLPELVIKEDATKPEIGGGLCQVSTTAFRAALNSGLDIVERINHKYRVSYYEPPIGLDATVYEPSPDLKFKNDTGNWILIQTSVVGNKLTFDFYGTKDGRTVSISEPSVYNFVEPEPTQTIETDTLFVGEEKYLEKAHTGSDASVTYTVTKDGQTLHKKTFLSHYVPWRAKLLVGIKPVEGAPVDPNAPPTTPPAATETTTSAPATAAPTSTP